VVVLDVPLLVQGGWHSRCDVVIGLACDDAIRHQRLAARGLSFGQISAREAAWKAGLGHDDADYQPDWTVDTAGDLAYTSKQVDRVWQRFRPHEHESSGELP
jgi:dephospho-CoA kinase